MDAVEDREPLSPGGKHRQAERGDQRQAIAGDKGVQLLGQVRSAVHECLKAGARCTDLARRQHAERRFDHAPHDELLRRPQPLRG